MWHTVEHVGCAVVDLTVCVCVCVCVYMCSQQDAQEFLISLLEGLQDDLNRVRDKNKKRHIDSSSEVETIRQDAMLHFLLLTTFFCSILALLFITASKSKQKYGIHFNYRVVLTL